MAVAPSSSPGTLDPKPDNSDPEIPQSASQVPSFLPPPASAPPAAAPAPAENPNPNANPTVVTLPPPSIPSFAPSFRPLGAPTAPQYSILPNSGLQNPSFPMTQSPGIQPPGVNAPGVSFSVPPVRPGGMYSFAPGQPPAAAPLAYGQVPMGYMTVPGAPPQAPPAMPPPFGYARYPAPYPNMVRPGFPPRPMPPFGVIPPLSRPPIPGVRGAPIVTPVLRPGIPMVAPPEKPQTTVYVGKIAPTADNEFLLSLLRLCGPVKSWKRAQDPSDGTPKGFGFCEFESAEGILRAMRVLSRLNIYGQELVVLIVLEKLQSQMIYVMIELNINQATREYLERYVEKKTEREKLKENEAQVSEKENESALDVVIKEPPKPIVEETNKDAEESGDKENHEKTQNFGIVTEEDRDADKDALEKITSMIEERLKTKPLPPPPPVQAPVDGTAKSNSDVHSDVLSKSREDDSDVDIMKSDVAEEKNDDEPMSENQPVTEHERPEISSADKGRRHDRSSRENGRERDLKRVKELNVERYERERERDRAKRERDRESKIREAERQYRDRVKLLETREREKEYQRHREKEREKEKERERRREILKDENESDDDDTRKRRRRSSVYEEKRRRRQREKEEDLDDRLKEGEDLADRLKEEEYLADRLKVEKALADRLKEEEEIADAKEAAIEEQPSEDDPMHLCSQVINEIGKPINQEAGFKVEGRENPLDQSCESVSASDNTGYGFYRSNSSDELAIGSAAASDMKQNSNVPAKKLGFGIIGSGKRTTVPSVFHEEDDEDADDKKMRPLVPIDYSTEELQAVPSPSGPPPNLVAATEFAKRISGVNPREDKRETERERRSSHRERDRYDDEHTRGRNGNKEKMHDKSFDRERDREDKPKPENKKLLDAKQLIDMIPKTKEELFAYEINWAVYDKHDLHGRMRPWISKKVTEFLGEEEPTLVDYIVSSTKDHVHASKMLDLLQAILDDEAEMFVLKMWRMLIFEIKKVEMGLSGKPRG